jgi:superfamily I DNA and/or RNA helicase
LTVNCPHLEMVVNIGDNKQLGVHSMGFDGDMSEIGLQSILDAVVPREASIVFPLRASFRSHSTLTACVSGATYQGNLRSAIEDSDRRWLIDSEFPMPLRNVPLVLLQLAEADQQLATKSRQNEPQADIATVIVKALWKFLGREKASIKIIVFYTGQDQLIAKKYPALELLTGSVDSMQGKEADIVVLLTVRSEVDETIEEKRLAFVGDPKRGNVAVSRARHGLFIIGDFGTLLRLPFWNAYVHEASAFTPIYDAMDYAQLVHDAFNDPSYKRTGDDLTVHQHQVKSYYPDDLRKHTHEGGTS